MNHLKSLRKQYGWTALRLGQETTISENRIYQLERERLRPKPAEAELLAAALHTDVPSLFPDVGARKAMGA